MRLRRRRPASRSPRGGSAVASSSVAALGLAGCAGARRTRWHARTPPWPSSGRGWRGSGRTSGPAAAVSRLRGGPRVGGPAGGGGAGDGGSPSSREAQERLAQRLAVGAPRRGARRRRHRRSRRAAATLAEQFARLEAGSATAASLLRGPGLPGPAGRGPRSRPRSSSTAGWRASGRASSDRRSWTSRSSPTSTPAIPLAPSAHFWIGEAYFRSRDFEQAASQYQKAIDLAPAGDRTPDALLRLGLALRSLHREDRARDVWARLVRDFPDSEAALRARAVLRQPGRTVPPAEPR